MRVRRRHKPTRDKHAKLVVADDALGLGLEPMQQAERQDDQLAWRRALLYRDGLALALLALRPLRRANYAGLRLGEHLQQRGSSWWLRLDADETKTHVPIEVPWLEVRITALETWLTPWRRPSPRTKPRCFPTPAWSACCKPLARCCRQCAPRAMGWSSTSALCYATCGPGVMLPG
jgi:hypothetical protein